MGAVIASGPTFGDGSGGTTVVNAAPSGITDRDWLLAVLLSDNDGDAAAMTAPAGWYQVSSSADTVTTLGGFGKIWTRRAVDAGPGPYSFPGGAGSDNTGFVFRIAGADPVQLFAAPPVWSNPGAGATTSLIAPSVTPGGSGLLICTFMLEGMFGGSISPPGGMSGTSVLNATGFLQTLPGSETVPPGPTGTRLATATTSGASNLHGFLAMSLVLADDTSSTYAGWFLGPPTLGRPWVPASPQWAGGEFVAPPQVEPTTGVGALGLAATAVARKVVAVTATTGLGLSSTSSARKITTATGVSAVAVAAAGTARKVSAAAGTGALALTPTGLARKAAPATGSGIVGLAGVATARKTAPATGTASTGLVGTVAARKAATATGRGLAGLTGTVAVRKVSTVQGLAGTGLACTTVARKVNPVTGSAAIAFVSTGTLTSVSIRAVTARTLVGLAGLAQARKQASAAGIAAVGAASTAVARKVTPAVAVTATGLTTAGTARKIAPGAGRLFVGLAGTAGSRKVSGALARVCFAVTTYYQPPGRVHVYAGAAAVTAPHAGNSIVSATQTGQVTVQ